MISVVLPTHNPDLGRLRRTLDALVGQSLPRSSWELLVVDNASSPPLSSTEIDAIGGRLVLEPTPGLTPARLAGIRAAQANGRRFTADEGDFRDAIEAFVLVAQAAGALRMTVEA